jgi:hypothetical protein
MAKVDDRLQTIAQDFPSLKASIERGTFQIHFDGARETWTLTDRHAIGKGTRLTKRVGQIDSKERSKRSKVSRRNNRWSRWR